MLETRYIKLDALNPQPKRIDLAANMLKQGQVVAFPTETVYGVGADAWSEKAVLEVFKAKQRPVSNPLLVHVSNLQQVLKLVEGLTEDARKLIDKFWPGPLSIILPARTELPAAVTGGQIGVGLRMPDHSVALALIEAAGPLAATSANLSGRPSPTNAQHVREDLDGKIAAVLDAGPTGLGLESSIIDLCKVPYRWLRPGGVSREQVQEVLDCEILPGLNESDDLPHYQTKCQVILSEDEADFRIQQQYYLKKGMKIILVYNNYYPESNKLEGNISRFLDLNGRDSDLYTLLRDAERQADVLIFAPLPPEKGSATEAVLDRIRKAARV